MPLLDVSPLLEPFDPGEVVIEQMPAPTPEPTPRPTFRAETEQLDYFRLAYLALGLALAWGLTRK